MFPGVNVFPSLLRKMEDGGLLADVLPEAKRKMLITLSVFERQPLQGPVKIADSVYCVFDPVGSTQERRERGEIKWIVLLPERKKNPPI